MAIHPTSEMSGPIRLSYRSVVGLSVNGRATDVGMVKVTCCKARREAAPKDFSTAVGTTVDKALGRLITTF